MAFPSLAAEWSSGTRLWSVRSRDPAPPPAATEPHEIIAWADLRPVAQLYVGAVVALGGVAVALSIPQAVGRDGVLFAALTILSLLTSGAKVRLPMPRSASTLTVCYVLDFTTLLLLGRPAATCTAAIGAWSQCAFRRQYRTPAYQTWFSIGALALTVQAAGFTQSRMADASALPAGIHFEASIVAAIVFFLANSLLVAGAVALSTGNSTLRVWSSNYLWSWPGHLLGFVVALGAAAGIGRSGFWMFPLAIGSLVLTHENFKSHVARVADSMTDPLTGLSNMRHLLGQIAHELARASRDDTPCAVILVDLDGFKSINDLHGHRAGDHALRQVAQCLQQSIRSYDTCARYGGDEFVVVLPGCDIDLAQRKATALETAVAAIKCEPRPGTSVPLRISAGVALFPDDGDTLDGLLAAADARMYADKATHRSDRPPAHRKRDGHSGGAAAGPEPSEGQLQAQLRQSQKLATIGQLTGGVVHDFNNVLTAILGYSDLLTEQIGPDKPIGRDLQEIVGAAQHGAALTHRLLAFSRNDRVTLAVVDVNEVVRGVRTLLRRLIEERIAIKTKLASDLHSVIADMTELEQVVINLSVNARDAMSGGGELVIETRNVELDADFVANHPGAKPGAHVMLSVTDTGTGMTPEVRAQIFNPFFTTKARGEGTGLGLSNVTENVARLGGCIDLDTAPGKGTTFRIYLPRAVAAAATATATATQTEQPTQFVGGETILLVEDEDAVREFASKALRRHGYRVLEAANAAAAMTMLEVHPASIDLLLTDVVLPGMDGRELAERVVHDRPRTPVLFTTGYVDRDLRLSALRAASLLDKPFTARALLAKIRELLDRGAAVPTTSSRT